MPPRIERLTEIPENELEGTIEDFRDAKATVVTALNDGQGTFTVEASFGGPSANVITKLGKMSIFGGPDDLGVRQTEGLALFEPQDVATNPDIFLPSQPPGTTGLARRLNPQAKYLACRWDYLATPKSFLKNNHGQSIQSS